MLLQYVLLLILQQGVRVRRIYYIKICCHQDRRDPYSAYITPTNPVVKNSFRGKWWPSNRTVKLRCEVTNGEPEKMAVISDFKIKKNTNRRDNENVNYEISTKIQRAMF